MDRIIFVGRMLEDKGVRELFAAWKQVCSRGVKVGLILCGDVDIGNPRSLSREDLENMADEKDCVWLGRIGNVLEEMTAANLIVLPTYREGLPRQSFTIGWQNYKIRRRHFFQNISNAPQPNAVLFIRHILQILTRQAARIPNIHISTQNQSHFHAPRTHLFPRRK